MGEKPPRHWTAAHKFACARVLKAYKLLLRPIFFTGSALRQFLLELFAHLAHARVFDVGGYLIEFFFRARYSNVVFVAERKNESARVVLRSSGAPENLMRGTRFDEFFISGGPLHECREHDGPGRQVNARRERFRADTEGEQFHLKELFDDPAVTGKDSGMVHSDSAQEELAQFRPSAVLHVESLEFARDFLLTF